MKNSITEVEGIGTSGGFEVLVAVAAFLDKLDDAQREQLGREVWDEL